MSLTQQRFRGVTGLAGATIVATIALASCRVTESPIPDLTRPVAAVDVAPPSATVPAGQTVQLTATPKDSSGNPLAGRAVTWASGSTSIATVNASGLVTGVAAGSATITATSEGKSGSAAITVTAVSGGAAFGHVFLVTG